MAEYLRQFFHYIIHNLFIAISSRLHDNEHVIDLSLSNHQFNWTVRLTDDRT